MKKVLGSNVMSAAVTASAADMRKVVSGKLGIYADFAVSTVNLITDPIYSNEVLSCTQKVGSAGVKQISAIKFSAGLADTAYKIVLKYYGLSDSFGAKTYVVVPASVGAFPTATEVRDAFLTAIQNDASSLVVATAVGADEIKLEEVGFTTEGFAILDASAVGTQTGTVTVAVAHVTPFGLGSDLIASKKYASIESSIVPTTVYDVFSIQYTNTLGESFTGGSKKETVVFDLLVDKVTAGANYTAWTGFMLNLPAIA